MLLPEKILCRGVQFAFRLAIPILPYREPEILHRVADVIPLLQKKQITSVLLVTDPGVFRQGIPAPLTSLLEQAGIHCAVYDQTCPNPTTDNVAEAKALYIEKNCQALIAFGGGSSMDCAKGVGACIAYPRKSLSRMKGLLKVLRPIPLLIAIPTTAGTGSEATLTAVITDRKAKHKYTMNDFTLIPRVAVLDPKMTYSLPPHLTATTGMDALTHSVEAYIGGSTTKRTRSLAIQSVKLIFENIQTAYALPENADAREAMLKAAYMAGVAFSRSYVGYVHAVAHSLGGQYNTPHGLANAVLLPIVLKSYGASAAKKLHDLGIAAGVAEKTQSHKEGAEAFIQAVENLNRQLGIPQTLPNIQPGDIPRMARHAAREANPLYPVPKLMTARELETFYRQVSDRRKA